MSNRSIVVPTKPSSALGEALTLRAGRGFETRSHTSEVGGFIIVDAWLPPGLRAPLHSHERAYLTLILEGGFDEDFGSKTLSLRAGALNFVPQGLPHRTRSHGARGLRMEVPDVVLEEAARNGARLHQPAMFTDPVCIAKARRIHHELRSRRSGWELVVHGLLLELLGLVIRDGSPVERRGARWLEDVKARIDGDWSRFVSLADLARPVGRHPMHVARSFRAAYGVSIGEYRRARQLQAAQERLLCSKVDLLEIALSCGFADRSHFSKTFRRAIGISPGEYRRTNGAGGPP